MFHTTIFLFAFITSFLLSRFFSKNVSNFEFYKIFSRERSAFHKDNKEILKVGGLIILMSSSLAILISVLFKKNLEISLFNFKKICGFSIGALIIFMLGFWDDAKKIGYKSKIFWQIVATIPLMLSGYNISKISFLDKSIEVYWIGYAFMVLWVLLITNAINLLDGLDGLAAGVSLISFSAIAIMAHGNFLFIELLCFIFVGSLLAFLIFNFYPARLYLGDNGSLLLGYVLAVISLQINIKLNTLTALSLPILLTMLPIGSIIYSFFRRIKNGKNPFISDKMHLHYLLLNSGIPHPLVVVLFWIASFVFALLCVISYFLNRRFEFFLLSLGLMILVISYFISISIILKGKINNEANK